MFRKLFLGDSRFWQTPASTYPLSASLRLLVATLIPVIWMVRRLLSSGYVFVGNDSDATQMVGRLKFARLWLATGATPWWNPYSLLGQSNLAGVAQPYSLINLLQRLTPTVDEGLNHTLALLLIIAAIAWVQLLWRLRYTPLSSVLFGIYLAGTGTVIGQLFAGHLALFSALCLGGPLMLTTLVALRRAPIYWCLPATFCASFLATAQSSQGTYLVLWLNTVFFCLRGLLGSPDPVPVPTVWTAGTAVGREGNLIAQVQRTERFGELFRVLTKLTFIYLSGFVLATFSWYPAFASAADPGLDGDTGEIFTHSAPVISWLTALVPHCFLGSGQHYSWTGWPAWEGQPGMGILLTLFASMALLRRTRDLFLPLTVLLCGTLLAAGTSTPFFRLYALLDPIVAHMEVPSRFYYVTNFGLALLAGWGLDALIAGKWRVSDNLRNISVTALASLGLLWLAGYYLDGSETLWSDFVRHLQLGYNYGGVEPVSPPEYYILEWTRASAAFVMIGCLGYSVLRAPLKARPYLVTALLLLDSTRFLQPYMNLRPANDFVPNEKVLAILQRQKIAGKINNQFDPLWEGGFGIYLYSEWNNTLAKADPDTKRLLEMATKIFYLPDNPELTSLNYPCLFNRMLGVQAYVVSAERAKETGVAKLFAETTSYAPEGEAFELKEDSVCRPAVYASRAAEPCPSLFQMLRSIRSNPEKVSERVNFLDLSTYKLLRTMFAQRFSGIRYPDKKTPQDVVTLTSKTPNQVTVDVKLELPALIVVNESWSPDWNVLVDQQPDVCLPSQLGLNRAVLVDAGVHQVIFYHQPAMALRSRNQSWKCLVLTLAIWLFIIGSRRIYEKATA